MPVTYKKIASVTVGAGGASNIQFTTIPGTYTDLIILGSFRCSRAAVDTEAYIKFNNSTSNYSYRVLAADGTTVSSTNASTYPPYVTNANNATASTYSSVSIYIPNYAGSNNKSLSIESTAETNATNTFMYMTAGLWANTSAITNIELYPFSGTWNQYTTAVLYGISKS
jgi:hypothetical protein